MKQYWSQIETNTRSALGNLRNLFRKKPTSLEHDLFAVTTTGQNTKRISGNPRMEPNKMVNTFSIDIEKISGQGEDSEPLLHHDDQSLLIGVFDGLGGAGSAVYESDGAKHTGAYYASRISRSVVLDVFRSAAHKRPGESVGTFLDPDFIKRLQSEISRELRIQADNLEQTPSKLRSTLIPCVSIISETLPTPKLL